MVRLIALVACLVAIGSSAAPIFRRAALEPVESEDPKDWPSKAQLQKALATAPGKAFFWSGQTNGVRVFEHAQDVALKAGGTTLEVALTKAGFKMPGFPRKSQAGKDKWVEAAGIYAAGATGDVNVVLGRELRPKNVFERLEKVNLQANPKVTSITKIDQITGEKSILFQRNKKRHEDDVEVELEHDENAQVEARDLDLEDLPIEDILLEKRAKKTTAKPKPAPKPKPVAKKPAPKPAPKKTAAPKPAAPKKTAAPKPAAPKKTAAPKPAAPKKTAAPKPAAPKKTAAPKPAAPKPAAPKKTTAAKKPATTKAAAPKPTKAAAAKTTKAASKKVAATKSTSKKATATKSSASKKPTASKTPPNLQGFEDLDI